MANVKSNRYILLLFGPPLCGSLMAFLPLKPPAKIYISVGECALMSLAMFCMCIYDAFRRFPFRPSIPFVWLSYSIGLGIFSVALWKIAQTWGIHRAKRPFELVGLLDVIGFLFLLVGTIGVSFAAQKKREMHQTL